MANSIDYMNYIISQTYEQTFIYKKDLSEIIITGGNFYITSENVSVAEVDTSVHTANQTLAANSTNYIYVKNGAYYITTTVDDTLFLIATVVTALSGVINSINKYNTVSIGTIGETGATGPTGAT